MKRLLRYIAILGLAALPLAVHADAVTSFHSDVTVSRDNVVSVKETIVYDPQDGSHHGIFRFVPAQFRDSEGHTYYSTIKFDSVTDPSGGTYNIADQHNNRNELYLKIGDPGVTLNGPQTYIISYQITPLAVKGDGFDRLTLNITGQDWDTTIDTVTASVHFDPAATISGTQCFTGTTGSTDQACTITKTGSDVTLAATQPLGPNQGVTADVHLAAGSFSTYLLPDVVPPLGAAAKVALALSGLAALVALLALLRTAWFYWADQRERKAQTIIPLYEAPDGLTPAQMGILESPQSDLADVTATLIDLAVRGYIKIEQTQAKAWWRSADYTLTMLQGNQGLAPYETNLLAALFGNMATFLPEATVQQAQGLLGKFTNLLGGDLESNGQVKLSELKNNRVRSQMVSQVIQSMRREIGKDLKEKGYYFSSPTNYVWLFRLIVIAGALVAAAGAAGTAYNGIEVSLAVPVLALAAAVGGFALTYWRTDRTLAGNQEWAKVEGFKWFLTVTEKDRLAFTDAPDKTPELFSKMLPYAVALKVEKEWAKQFEGIDVSRAVGGWYVGSSLNNFSATAFATDLSSSFSGAVSSNFAGASGGGSAGGGGGGGGGGGW